MVLPFLPDSVPCLLYFPLNHVLTEKENWIFFVRIEATKISNTYHTNIIQICFRYPGHLFRKFRPNNQLSKPTHTKALKNSGLASSNIWLCVNISLLIACFFSTDDLFGHFSSVSVNSHKINIKDTEKSANSCLSYPVTCAQCKQKNVQKATLSHQLLKVKWVCVCLHVRVFSSPDRVWGVRTAQ